MPSVTITGYADSIFMLCSQCKERSMPSAGRVVLKKCVIVSQPRGSDARETAKVSGHVRLVGISRITGDRCQRTLRGLGDQSRRMAQACERAEKFERHTHDL